MKPIQITKCHDISAFASTDTTHYVLNGIHYNASKGRLEATDGRIAVQIPVVASEDFPRDCFGADDKDAPDAIIPTAPFQRALKNVSSRPTLPILESVALTAHADKLALTTTDLDTVQHVEAKPIEGSFPAVDSVFNRNGKTPTVTIGLSGALLARVCAYAIKHALGKHELIVFKLYNELSPVDFTVHTANGDLTGCLMPVRVS